MKISSFKRKEKVYVSMPKMSRGTRLSEPVKDSLARWMMCQSLGGNYAGTTSNGSNGLATLEQL
jgi:hypothetical protein